MGQDGWRPMATEDVEAVARMSDSVHGHYTERAEIYAERLALYPNGCFLFERDEEAAGYLICHPWRRDKAVPLDTLLHAIPHDSDCFYLHDLALLPSARGTGAGRAATEIVMKEARTAGFGEIRLVAVNGADDFWAAQGFVAVTSAEGNDATGSYGDESVAMRRLIAD